MVRAKALAARARADFAQKEYHLKTSLAKLEEEAKNKKKLQLQKQNAFEEHVGSLFSVKIEHPRDRTDRYVAGLDEFTPVREKEANSTHGTERKFDIHSAREFEPRQSRFVQSAEGDFAKFLLKKDLHLSRLAVFNEQAECFAVWKTSFISVMTELSVSPQEELDLLVKHLGSESAKYAQSIRASNATDPARGLRLLWRRLDERFGSPELIEARIRERVESFPQITKKDSRKLYDLCDLCDEINSAKNNEHLGPLLKVYDTSIGANKIVEKLPHNLKQKWTERASAYKQKHGVVFPPFNFLVEFLQNVARVQNDPAFVFDSTAPSSRADLGKTSVVNRRVEVLGDRCPMHNASHPLSACKAFQSKSFEEKQKFLREKSLCFRCLVSTEHIANKCTATVKCEKCGKPHLAVMHRGFSEMSQLQSSGATGHGGERGYAETGISSGVGAKCTSICGAFGSRSCGKVVLTRVFSENCPQKSVEVYAVIDDQSNRTLASPELLDLLGIDTEQHTYTMSSCSGTHSMSGRKASGLCVQSHDKQTTLALPVVIECDSIPQDMSEIPTPDVAHGHDHLQPIAASIPPLHPEIKIGLLIGRDLPMAHHVLEQILGAPSAPFAQRLPLGWTVVGDVCLGKVHKPLHVRVNKTYVTHSSSRETIFEPCTHNLKVSEEETVFRKTTDDEKIGLSVEDRKFIAMMDEQFQKDANGRWSAPLPFRSKNNVRNNRTAAVKRAHALKKYLQKDPTKRKHFFKFMAKLLDTGATEVAPTLEDETEAWYLPLFGVYHPKKPDKIRGVFDSSATFEGVCLNDMMYSGPDLTNSLIGILLRFRQNTCPMTADIEQMFYQFFVDEAHRDYLRFFWHKDNDFDKPLIEYRMCVHVFGNSPSPAVAAYGLRKTVESSANDVKTFVSDDFYIDDGVTAVPDSKTAINLMQRTQTDLLEKGGLKLHKIASSDREFLKAFDTGDLSEELQSIDLSDTSQPLPVHSCLGLMWDLNSDSFVLNPAVASCSGPFTRRGILSALNSIYDPLGFLAPATIAGKILLREISPNGKAWDEPLSEFHLKQWDSWKRSLESVDGRQVPRMYVPFSLSQTEDANFHIFCDASEKAIAAVAYVTVTTGDKCNSNLGFVMGKAKVAPSSGHTIPRLELCSAVLATEVWQIISEQLGVNPKSVTFYSDSKVVLGYVNNEKRRFHTYVSNRVELIRHVSDPNQWKYVSSKMNPADVATRGSDVDLSLKQNVWLQGPKEWLSGHRHPEPVPSFSLISPEEDREIRPNVCKTEIDDKLSPFHVRFKKFSTWNALLNTFSRLRHISQSFHAPTDICRGWHQCSHALDVDNKKNTETFILQTVQNNAFAAEIQCLRKGSSLPKKSPIISLSPYLDQDGLLRVGGRIDEAKETAGFPNVHPVILPKGDHVSIILVRHYHEEVKHQGRHFTEGALRSHGFWIVGAKRLVASVIQCCFLCRRLRGKLGQQLMSNLPADRVTPTAPFSHVGVDVFGPWSVEARRTRGGVANSKRWAVVFTCLAIRAVHIEVIEDMSSSSFINALRRFVSLRGPVKEIRPDRGTNFIGAAGELDVHTILKEDGPVSKHLSKAGVRWRFNPPHASHMGGSWERMIGVVRKILDSMLLDLRRKPLTHEVLCTLMAEICAIVNSRPITAISHDPDSPAVLTPSILLTMKGEEEQMPLEMSDLKDMYKSQWKHVQVLSNIFWNRWKAEYLQSLQERKKWQHVETNFEEGDIVLLCDSGSHRNNWPIGLVVQVFRSDSDSLVRSVEVKVIKDNQPVIYVRPITQLVRL